MLRLGSSKTAGRKDTQEITSVGQDVETLDPSDTRVGRQNGAAAMEDSWVAQPVKPDHVPRQSPSEHIPQRTKNECWSPACARTLTAALLPVADPQHAPATPHPTLCLLPGSWTADPATAGAGVTQLRPQMSRPDAEPWQVLLRGVPVGRRGWGNRRGRHCPRGLLRATREETSRGPRGRKVAKSTTTRGPKIGIRRNCHLCQREVAWVGTDQGSAVLNGGHFLRPPVAIA